VVETGVGSHVRGGGEAVVGGENDERVLRESVFLEGSEDATDVGVDLVTKSP